MANRRPPKKVDRSLSEAGQDMRVRLQKKYAELRNAPIPSGLAVKHVSRHFELLDLVQKAHKALTKLTEFVEGQPSETLDLFKADDE